MTGDPREWSRSDRVDRKHLAALEGTGASVIDRYEAHMFAEIARELASARTLDETLQGVVDLACDVIEGCTSATISFIHRGGKISSPAFSGRLAKDADMLQYEVGEGPCLQAIREHETYRIDDMEEEERWPRFTERVQELGVASMLTFRLFHGRDTMGALNLYSQQPQAFDDEAEAFGTVFASHAAVALKSAISEAGDKEALESRDIIGQAKGILIERHGVSADVAFNVLRAASQRQNRRIRDIAEEIVRTAQLPEGTRPDNESD